MEPAALVPARRNDEGARIELPLDVLASAWFDERHGYALVRDARGMSYGIPLVVEPGSARIRRASAGDGTAAALASALDTGAGGFGVDVLGSVGESLSGEAAFDVDQTNDLVVVGERVVVKWDLHPAAGVQSGPMRLAALARAGFRGMARVLALVTLEARGGRFHVATLTEYVPGAVDGWEWAVDEVRALARGGASTIHDAVVEVGRLAAQMHVALAADGTTRANAEDTRRWARAATAVIADAGLAPDIRVRAEAAADVLASATGTPIVPIHGDLHVGQVLRAGEPSQYLVIDFDGNPTDSPDDRLAPQPVARDVASMLASWDHVGRVVLHRTDDLEATARDRVLAWIEWSQAAFLQSYESTLAEMDAADLLDRRLLMPYQLLQECREYAYARRYLPHWRYVPDAALPALVARAEQETMTS